MWKPCCKDDFLRLTLIELHKSINFSQFLRINKTVCKTPQSLKLRLLDFRSAEKPCTVLRICADTFVALMKNISS